MEHFTAEEKATITSTFAKIDFEQDGHDVLTSFGNLSDVATISGNAKVHAHGKKVLSAVAAQNLDDMKHHLADLGKSHGQELHVDPENFTHFGGVLISVLASKMGCSSTPQVQAASEKFVNGMAAALSQGHS